MSIEDIEPRVLFVGDSPSKANTNPIMAFIGSRSGKTLEAWTERLGLKLGEYMMINRTDEFFADCARSFYKSSRPVISLGVKADVALSKANVPHFSLPHPSGLNRKLNDKKTLGLTLSRCRRHIDAIQEFNNK